MKPIITLTLSAATLLTVACSLREKENTALLHVQQVNDDSIRVAEISQVKQARALKTAIQDSIAFYNGLLERQQNMLIQSRTAIYTANDEMTRIKAFHLGRLPQTRDAQVRDQELKIQTLVMEQTNLQAAIQQNTDQISRLKTELSALK